MTTEDRRLFHQRRYQRRKELWSYLAIRVDHEDMHDIRNMAQVHKTTISGIVRQMITNELENYRRHD